MTSSGNLPNSFFGLVNAFFIPFSWSFPLIEYKICHSNWNLSLSFIKCSPSKSYFLNVFRNKAFVSFPFNVGRLANKFILCVLWEKDLSIIFRSWFSFTSSLLSINANNSAFFSVVNKCDSSISIFPVTSSSNRTIRILWMSCHILNSWNSGQLFGATL